jgi:hypothetical protein
VPSGFDANVECVEPGGNTSGEINSSRAHAGEWVEAVRQRFAENDDVRFDAEVFHRPELSGAVKPI